MDLSAIAEEMKSGMFLDIDYHHAETVGVGNDTADYVRVGIMRWGRRPYLDDIITGSVFYEALYETNIQMGGVARLEIECSNCQITNLLMEGWDLEIKRRRGVFIAKLSDGMRETETVSARSLEGVLFEISSEAEKVQRAFKELV